MVCRPVWEQLMTMTMGDLRSSWSLALLLMHPWTPAYADRTI